MYVIEYVCVCHSIEAITPKSKVTAEMRKHLPDELLIQLASPAFVTSCMSSFGTSRCKNFNYAPGTCASESKDST